MIRIVSRAILSGGLSLLTMIAPVAQAAPVKSVAFPHEQSDRKPDPAARYGRLPNGMTYVLKPNKSPPGTAAIYMRVAAGSMMEEADQKGLAHFVEHMAFNGTKNIAESELKRILERHGFVFGADSNAFTFDSKTTYILNTPKNDAETFDTALFILREIAGNVAFNPQAVDRERGVVLSEERLRDAPTAHRNDKWNRWLYDGARYAGYYNPIGTQDSIRTVPASRLKAFYDTWYRPELTTLIIVGDFDVDTVETKIRKAFADWKVSAAMPEEPDWGGRALKGLQTFSYSEEGLADEIGVTWLGPAETRHDGVARAQERIQDNFLLQIVNRRLQSRASAPDSAFVLAGTGTYSVFQTGQAAFLSVVPKSGRAQEAFTQAYEVIHTLRTQGVTRDEVKQAVALLDSNMRYESSTRGAEESTGLADQLLYAQDQDIVTEGTDDTIALFRSMKPFVGAQDGMNARLRAWFAGDTVVLSHCGEDISSYDEAAMRADYERIEAGNAAAYSATKVKRWPYTHFGSKMSPTGFSYDKDFEYGHYTWPNGVTLNVKPMRIKPGEIQVQVNFAGGQMLFDPKTDPPLLLALGDFLYQGGLNKLTADEVGDTLRTNQVGVNYALYGDHAALAGTANAASLALQLQALMAYATDAAYRPDAFDRYRAWMPEGLRAVRSTPETVRRYYWEHILNSGDSRFDQTRLEKINALDYADLRTVFETSMANTPISITIVGDVDEKRAVTEVSKTFATLPARPQKPAIVPGADSIAFPPREHEFTLYHAGRADQSLSMAIWPTDDFYADPKAARGADLLAGIIGNRLQDEIRESQGADYAPTAFASNDDVYRQKGMIAVYSNIKAGGDGDFRKSVAAIVANLKTQLASDDEMDRVRKPILDGLDNQDNDNAYWVYAISRVADDPVARADWLQRRGQYEGLTPAYLKDLANRFLKDDTEIFLRVLPDPKKKPQ